MDGVEVNAGSDPLDINSTPLSFSYGDLNLDGTVNVADLLLGQRVLIGLDTLSPEQLITADVAPLIAGTPSVDGTFNLADLLVISRKVMGIVSF